MNIWIKFCIGLVIVGLISALLLVAGCKGSHTRDAADDTVKELSGKKNLDRYKKMKKEIGEIQKRQAQNYHQLDQNAGNQ
jgi:outer membrane murein-binding lipoprotein Lpp